MRILILLLLLCSCHVTVRVTSLKKYREQQRLGRVDTSYIESLLYYSYKDFLDPGIPEKDTMDHRCYVQGQWYSYDCCSSMDWSEDHSVCGSMGVIGISDSVEIFGTKEKWRGLHIFLSRDTSRFRKLFGSVLPLRRSKNDIHKNL